MGRQVCGGKHGGVPAGLKWKPRFLWKGYSISKVTEKKGAAMRAVGWDLGKSVNKVGGGHFGEIPFLAAALVLRPAHHHLDSLSDLPGPSEFLRSVAQLCSGSGDQGTYYLGEWQELS